MAKKSPLTLREAFGKKAKNLIISLTDKIEILIENKDSVFTAKIFTFGGTNVFDITEYVTIDLDMTVNDFKVLVNENVLSKNLFNDNLEPIPKKEDIVQKKLLSNYELMQEIDVKLINEYVKATGDEEFDHIDPLVYEYIDDIMTELQTSDYPYKARKKWDNTEKLLLIKEKLLEQIKNAKK